MTSILVGEMKEPFFLGWGAVWGIDDQVIIMMFRSVRKGRQRNEKKGKRKCKIPFILY